jgi:hypothetical protein
VIYARNKPDSSKKKKDRSPQLSSCTRQTEHMAMNSGTIAKQWLFSMRETLDHSKFIKVLVTLWAIWTARRKAIHEGLF